MLGQGQFGTGDCEVRSEIPQIFFDYQEGRVGKSRIVTEEGEMQKCKRVAVVPSSLAVAGHLGFRDSLIQLTVMKTYTR
ncbi:hypothetical protein CHUAL_012675 [Chamberlinius hualienensis]